MFESVASHCGDTPDDFVVADNVQLRWPGAQGDMEWEWRVVSLKDIFPGELPALGVQDKDVRPEEDLGGWRGGDVDTESRASRRQRGDRPEHGDGQPSGQGGGERRGESLAVGGSARIPSAPLAFAAVEGCPGSKRGGEHQGREEVIDVDADPPPPLASAGTSSIRRLRIAAHRTGAVASVLGKRKARQGSWVRLPERQLPAVSEVGLWARECLRCGEWDVWFRNVRACFPRVPPRFVGAAPDPIPGLGDGGG